MIREYDVSYADSGRVPYSKEFFLAATISLWLNFFMFPNSEANEIRVETFPMVWKVVRGTRVAISLSYLSSIYARLDMIIDGLRSPQGKPSELQVHCLLGWLVCYYPQSYNG